MTDATLDQVIELAFKLSLAQQAKLLERVAAHLAYEVESSADKLSVENLSGRTFEVWSPHDEGGAVAALNQALNEHKQNKQAQNVE